MKWLKFLNKKTPFESAINGFFVVVGSTLIVAFVVVVVELELDKLVEIGKKLIFVVAVGFGQLAWSIELSSDWIPRPIVRIEVFS